MTAGEQLDAAVANMERALTEMERWAAVQKPITDDLQNLDCYTEEEVARITKVKRGTLRVWRSRRVGPPFVQLSARTPRYPRELFWKWIRERLEGGKGKP